MSPAAALDRFLPFGLGLNDVIALMAGLAVLATFLTVWQALRANTSFERRLAQIADKKEAMRLAALATRRQRVQLTPASLIRELVTRLNLLRSHHATEARMMLARAGMRSRDAMIRYLFARLSLPLVFAVAAMIDGYTLHLLPVPSNLRLLAAAGAAVFGFFGPGIYISNLTKKRQKRMQLGLPDALDLMIICAEAGLSLDATLVRVSRELAAATPDLAEELAITSAELTFLPDRRQAFDNLNNRTDMPAIRGVVNTLMQTAKFGTPLAHSLRVLAIEYRDARMFKAEEKAARLPALMTVPMILFILPTLFIVLMGPAALGIIDTFNHTGGGGGQQHATVITHNDASNGSGASPQQTEISEKRAEEDQQKAAGNTPPAPEAGPPPASVAPAQQVAAVGEPIDVDVDARALSENYNLRVVVVPKDAPDRVADPKSFFANAKEIVAAQMHVTLTATTAGPSEVRLYSVPHFTNDYAVSARTPMMITPAVNPAAPPAK
ncbi:MAG TPA: type II secretion system F family protein [Stellaceae bacterium]|nr:type II secretion system F family protein [Stellaceae bacterium]